MKLGSIKRLEQFWYNLISNQKLAWKKDLDGVIVVYYPKVPLHVFNHVANIKVTDNETDNLIKRATEYFI